MTTKENVDLFINMIVSCYIKQNSSEPNLSLIANFHKVEKPKLNNQFIKGNVKLKNVCIYPIKSCGAFKVYDKWCVSSKGLLFDREWMIVNDNGVVLTQKVSTEMCLIRPLINLESNTLTLTYPNHNSFEVSLICPAKVEIHKGKICHSKVCGDQIEGIDYGDEVANWLSTVLNISGLRLLKQADNTCRTSKKSNMQLSLSNQSQFLLINSTSVLWLAEKVDDWVMNGIFPENKLESVIDRFRGNLIIESSNPLEELNWNYVQIGDIIFQVEGPCTRCQMICIDQNTAVKTVEPLKTIAREFQGKMRFGLYLTQISGGSSISTDDIIII